MQTLACVQSCPFQSPRVTVAIRPGPGHKVIPGSSKSSVSPRFGPSRNVLYIHTHPKIPRILIITRRLVLRLFSRNTTHNKAEVVRRLGRACSLTALLLLSYCSLTNCRVRVVSYILACRERTKTPSVFLKNAKRMSHSSLGC